MYECLRQNLELDSKGGRGIYFFIDRGLDIHLGVADKALLLRRWKEFDYSCFDDLWRDTFHTLVENGYTSTKIEYFKESDKKMLSDLVELANSWVESHVAKKER